MTDKKIENEIECQQYVINKIDSFTSSTKLWVSSNVPYIAAGLATAVGVYYSISSFSITAGMSTAVGVYYATTTSIGAGSAITIGLSLIGLNNDIHKYILNGYKGTYLAAGIGVIMLEGSNTKFHI